MKYAIWYLLKGPSKVYCKKLIKTIGPKYGEMHVSEINFPPHITVKSSFKTRREKKLIGVLEDFSKKNKKANLKIEGFGNFREFVAFFQVIFSKDAKKIQRAMYQSLENFCKIEPRREDLKFEPHATIAYGNSRDTFTLIWQDLMSLKKPVFNLEFDRFVLMKKKKGSWMKLKEFKLK